MERANRRPLSITVIGWLFVVTGCAVLIGAARALADPDARRLSELLPMAASGLLALVGGAFTLRGHGWARWALIVWMAFHIVLSLMHSWEELLMHLALFTPITVLLLRRSASAWFRAERGTVA
jgi:hypothetical protein